MGDFPYPRERTAAASTALSQTPPEMIYSPKEEVSSRRRREFHFCSYPYLPASQCLALKFLPASPDYLPSSHRKRTVEADYPNPLSNFSSLFAPLAEKINPPSCLFYPAEEEEEEEEYHVGSIQQTAFNASCVAERRDVRDGSQPRSSPRKKLISRLFRVSTV